MMTIEEMKAHEWIVSWSGGKDSTATILLMKKYGIPIKKIVYVRMMYNDTLAATLPIMTNFVDDTIKVFEKWGYRVDVVKSLHTLEEIMNRVYRRSKDTQRNGHKYKTACLTRGFCEFTGIKQQTIRKCNGKDPVYEMIGIAVDEPKRFHTLTDMRQSILVALGVDGEGAKNICMESGLLSPLYDLGMPRDGCWFCPGASKRQREYVRNNYPELLQIIYKDIQETTCISLERAKSRNNWIMDYLKERR